MKKVIIVIIILLVLIFLYGRYIEINNFKIKEYTITNGNIPLSFEEIKIVHFSDLLYYHGYNTKNLDKLVKNINNIKPDVIIFSGDLFKKNESYNEDDYNILKETLSNMEASLYKYAVIGDNDEEYLEQYKDLLYESDFQLLDNENMLFFYKDNTPINIIGLTNLDNIETLLETDTEYNYEIVIIHKPDNFDKLSNYGINTILSGHSLGGIVNIPYYGGIITTKGAKKYVNDYYKLNNSEIFISNGLGYHSFNFRLFNTPSINVYRFSN